MRRRSADTGQAVVEFALVLPLFLLLLFAITEFGRVWMTQHVLTTASRAGARVGILPASQPADVTTQVNTYLTGAGMDPAAAVVTVTGVGSAVPAGTQVQVQVAYDISILSGSLIPVLQGTITLNSTTIMRHE